MYGMGKHYLAACVLAIVGGHTLCLSIAHSRLCGTLSQRNVTHYSFLLKSINL